MELYGVNILVIAGAAVAAFAFGAVYYTTLAKPWMAAIGKTEAEVKEGESPIIYAMTFLAQLVIAWVLAGVIVHVAKTEVTVYAGVVTALFAWAGFVMTTMIVNHRFQGAKWSLTLIDGGHWLGVLLIQGIIMGIFGVEVSNAG